MATQQRTPVRLPPGFSEDEFAAAVEHFASEIGAARPAIEGDVDWDRVSRQRFAIYTIAGVKPPIPKDASEAERVRAELEVMGLDATRKWRREGFEREWPAAIVMDEKTKQAVDAMWDKLGL